MPVYYLRRLTSRPSLILLLTFLLFIFLFDWHTFINSPIVPAGQSIVFDLYPGTTLKQFANQLEQKTQLKRPRYLRLLAYLKHEADTLKVGEYLFTSDALPSQILKQVSKGDVLQHAFTIIEGWSIKQVLTALQNETKFKHELSLLNKTDLMKKMGEQNKHPEGLFYPDTYFYTKGMSDKVILQRAKQAMQDKLMLAWEGRAKNLPYKTPYSALIAASLIEKETHLVKEKVIISRVILNRLKKRMYLQFDPTVIYGLGENYDGTLSKADLKKDTPYNTYRHKGLPPTPIGAPGWDSIWAALHPQINDYLYFVAKGDGSHQFTKTLKEHKKAVKRYRAMLKAKKDKAEKKNIKKEKSAQLKEIKKKIANTKIAKSQAMKDMVKKRNSSKEIDEKVKTKSDILIEQKIKQTNKTRMNDRITKKAS